MFLQKIKELPTQAELREVTEAGHNDDQSWPRWVMKAANDGTTTRDTSIRAAARHAWIGFVDLIKVRALQSSPEKVEY